MQQQNQIVGATDAVNVGRIVVVGEDDNVEAVKAQNSRHSRSVEN
jgi:hypothetical protein